MKRCIFCGKSEDEFDSKNMWSDEHIIPECLGNSTLKINNVCKHCNSSLGTYVDNYFVNHHSITLLISVGIINYFNFTRISSALIPSARSFFRTASASAFFASSAAF